MLPVGRSVSPPPEGAVAFWRLMPPSEMVAYLLLSMAPSEMASRLLHLLAPSELAAYEKQTVAPSELAAWVHLLAPLDPVVLLNGAIAGARHWLHRGGPRPCQQVQLAA